MGFITNRGEDLDVLMAEEKVLLVFLRHFGCTFCRETMSELAKARLELERSAVHIVVVHMVDFEMAARMLSVYDLQNVNHISDPTQQLYTKYGLGKTGFVALYGIKNWWRALVAGLVKGHLIGKPAGDPFQMPGVFFLEHNRIMNKFTYRYVSDRPDFVRLASIKL